LPLGKPKLVKKFSPDFIFTFFQKKLDFDLSFYMPIALLKLAGSRPLSGDWLDSVFYQQMLLEHT
jgi:hypothetical protein